ncbi:MAG: 4-alpha-glucanotransferase [Actinobacteria bacterium]|nr:4-alpha-glucanotransferase [Actinomycetota bacterium]
MTADPWGIEPAYWDAFGTWREADPGALASLRRSMGAGSDDPGEAPPSGRPLRVVRPGHGDRSAAPGAVLVLEDGTHVALDGELPPDLPLGYHCIVGPDGGEEHLIASPGRVALPPDLRTWGLTCQLYAARSTRSWGLGDLADLRRIVAWSRARGAGVVGINPLHAPNPLGHPADSPYSPSSRRWRDPLYLAIEEVPGAGALPDLAELAAAGQALNAGHRIDRAATWALKLEALERLWARFDTDPRFDAYRHEHGADLDAWATYCALARHHGTGWRSWPAEHRRPEAPAVAAFAAEHRRDVAFWAWLQWLLDGQLAASGAAEVAVADLAVGFDDDGADAWQWQDLVAGGVRIGAPPDLLGPEGQDWGLPPFVPWRLRDAGYQPLAATIRAVARHARGLRIDHVMGLFRLWWVPEGRGATDGAYVRWPGRELLDVVALESHRAGVLVVGEDLGTVEDEVRAALAEADVLSTRLVLFEERPPREWPELAMAAVTTHDLPTIAGVASGIDLADQRAAGTRIAPDGDDAFRHRLGVDGDRPLAEAVVDLHRALGASPCRIATATLDDLLGAEHRPNLPGTVDEHPNWRIPLPVPLDDLAGHALAEAVADALADTRGRMPR